VESCQRLFELLLFICGILWNPSGWSDSYWILVFKWHVWCSTNRGTGLF